MIALQRPVALAMTAYVRAGFRVRQFGLEHLRLEPRTILAPNHRSDNDVPLIVSVLYPEWSRAVARGLPWPTFAADDHAFFRGFLAGYPEGIPLALRRLAWPVRVGGVLERYLQCVPVREPGRMRLVELLQAAPDQLLDGRLPRELDAALRERAARLGRGEPLRGSDVLGGGYADLLWAQLDRFEGSDSESAWRAHSRAAVADKHRLLGAVSAGGLVVIFPEGELSVDGQIGPLQLGLASLARRGRAKLVQPIAISYDPLTYGRTKAYVSFAPAIEPLPGRLGRDVSEALRRATPLTAGQIAATVLRAGGSYRVLERRAAEWIAGADDGGRPVEPALRGPRRRLTLRGALRAARRLGGDHRTVAALARELEIANSSR